MSATAVEQHSVTADAGDRDQVPEAEESLVAMRRRLEEELGADIAAAEAVLAARRARRPTADLRPSGIDGFMDDHDDNDPDSEEG